MIDHGHIMASSLSKAKLFNDYFVTNSTMEEPPEGFALPPMHFSTNASLSEIHFNPYKVCKVLKELKVNKANGPDLISNRMLKELAEVLSKPLSDMFNKSMQLGAFPDCWKRANVIPVYKKSDKHVKENYRPISLLSCVGKVMERIVFNELYDYCQEHNLLT